MLFISGVHGVGKSYFCDRVNADLGIDTFSASALISERKQMLFDSNKLIPDIDDNQRYLLAAVSELNATNPLYLLDGHFSDIDLNDSFFDELKSDYPGNANSTGFVEWFNKKAASNSTASYLLTRAVWVLSYT